MNVNCPDCVHTDYGAWEPCELCARASLRGRNVTVRLKFDWVEPPGSHHFCFRCGKDMRYPAVHGPAGAHHGDELSNECTVIFAGGYGSFIDTAVDGQMPQLTVCHECGHQLCQFLGVDPRMWHTHSVYGGQHDDHHDRHDADAVPEGAP